MLDPNFFATRDQYIFICYNPEYPRNKENGIIIWHSLW